MPAPPPRDTTTGDVFEMMVPGALRHGGYACEKPNKPIGTRLGGGRHFVDILATKEGESILVSLKWQQTSGTAEQKIPFEIMCLAEAVKASDGRYHRAYLVLGGNGWTLRKLYVDGGLSNYLKNCDAVTVLDLETFIARANKGQL